MIEIIRKSPEKRVDDLHAILKNRKEVEGRTEFGISSIREVREGYLVNIASHKPGLNIYFIIDNNGQFICGDGYYEIKPGAKPKELNPMDISFIKEQLNKANQIIDKAIATFQENTGIDPREKEIALKEESIKFTDAIRQQIIDISNLNPEICKAKSGELQAKKSEAPPVVINSFNEKDWWTVIQRARIRIQQQNFKQI